VGPGTFNTNVSEQVLLGKICARRYDHCVQLFVQKGMCSSLDAMMVKFMSDLDGPQD